MELLYKTCYGLTAFLGVVQGLFVLYKNPRSRVNVMWALMNFAIVAWSVHMVLILSDLPYYTLLLWARIGNGAAMFIPVFFAHFCLALLDKPLRQSRLAVAGYVIALGMSPFVFTPWFIPSVEPKFLFSAYPNPGVLYMAYTLHFFILVVYAHILLLRHLARQPIQRQNQIKYVLFGMGIGYICGSTCFLAVYDIDFNPWPSLFTPLYGAFITYAILRYRLMDIKVVITRTGILAATYLVVLGLPFAVGGWGRVWLSTRLGESWWLVPVGLCTVLATIGPFAYAYLRNQVEARLLKEQRRYQQVLQHAARGMTRVRNVAKLARFIVCVISDAVRVEHASLFLLDQATHRYVMVASRGPKRFVLESRYAVEPDHALVQWLITHRRILSEEVLASAEAAAINQVLAGLRAVLLVPGYIEKDLVGWLALGKKLSGEGYSGDDLHAFSTLANEAAVAVENARSYEELQKAHDQLRITYDRLVDQERFVAAGQFATGLAHEIKNPLSAIKTFAEFLPEKYKDPDFRGTFFRIVQSEVDRINAIVKELSDFAKPAPLSLKSVRVSVVLKDTLALLSGQCLKLGVKVKPSFRENGTSVRADPQQLKQVFLNLFLNSLDAMPDGGSLEVATHVTGDRLTVSVQDTGCGVSEAHLPKLWDPFFTTKERGMGLGLSIVKGIIERHGGAIDLRSQEGQGTTVLVKLPVASS